MSCLLPGRIVLLSCLCFFLCSGSGVSSALSQDMSSAVINRQPYIEQSLPFKDTPVPCQTCLGCIREAVHHNIYMRSVSNDVQVADKC